MRGQCFSVIILLLTFLGDANAGVYRFANYPQANANFTGRSQEISEIKQFFDRTKNKSKAFVLAGISGIGKTQIAKKYAHTYSKQYDIILWIDASHNITQQLKNFIRKHGAALTKKNYYYIDEAEEDQLIGEFKNIIYSSHVKWLLIFDNVNTKEEIIKYLPSEGDIIITTKSKLHWSDMKEVQKLRRGESIELLSKLTGSKDRKSLSDLAELLHDYPLALSQAGVFIKEAAHITLRDYIDLYTQQRIKLWDYEKKLLDSGAKPFDDYEYTVKTSLEINIERLETCCPIASDLLKFLSFMENENIPEEVITHYFKGDALQMEETIALLRKRSLIDIKKDDKGYGNLYGIHEMLQSVVQDLIKEDIKPQYIAKLSKSYNAIIPQESNLAIPMLLDRYYLIEQLDRIFQYSERYKVYNNEIINLYTRRLEYCLSSAKDFKAGGSIISKVEMVRSNISNINNITMAEYYLTRGWYFITYLEDIGKGMQDAEMTKQHLEAHGERDDKVWLGLYNRFASLYVLQGDAEEALRYSNLGEHIIKNSREPLYSQDIYYKTRAKIFEDLGMLGKALTNGEMAIEAAYDHNKRNALRLSVVPPLIAQVRVLTKLELHKQARSRLNVVKSKLHEVFGRNSNYYTPQLNMCVAFYEYNQGKLDNARRHVNAALRALNRKSFSRLSAEIYTVLGDIESKDGHYALAQKRYLAAEQIYSKLFKKPQIDDMSALYQKLAINSVKLRDSHAIPHYLNKHINLFGKTHKRSLDIIDHLQDKGLY